MSDIDISKYMQFRSNALSKIMPGWKYCGCGAHTIIAEYEEECVVCKGIGWFEVKLILRKIL